ncbi:hypothetical protein ARMGADRAFT_345497 [Armillaria gallica]|uniref:Peptidase C14 caspase domain-containing protein n=1 Tax=Armillaria gallica TaxID=47427 RepID=A0A2H3DBV0_ARMGA|nr:hypothetical protein ARMGADRAFT_345497 [Armillaria gallica]
METLTLSNNAYQVPLNYASSTNLPFDKRTLDVTGQHHDHGYPSDASRRTEGPQAIQASKFYTTFQIVFHCMVTNIFNLQSKDRIMQSLQTNIIGSCESSGRKRALCIGIDYRRQRIELQGCIKDAKSIVKFLTEHGYRAQDITLLTDETDDKPTKENILNALTSLVKGAQKNDSLFLHYSGHGGQVPDQDDDEDDGEDEGSSITLFHSLDNLLTVHILEDIECFDSSVIIDDDIHKILQSLPSGCRLTALFDSCHSGTILDLPYTYNCIGRCYGTEPKLRISADIVCWSGAKDNQLGADTPCGGAMTCAFIESLQRKPMQSYKELLHSIRTIVDCKKGNQTPQLSSSLPIDASRQFIF